MHLLLGLSGGLLLGLVAFDLLPEVFHLDSRTVGTTPLVMVLFVAGFLALHIIEGLSGAHEPAESEYGSDHEHRHGVTAGLIGASAMAVHVLLDGVAVGVAFQLSTGLGIAVAVAVVGHAFTDGLNTVAMLVNTGNWRRSSARLLGVDAVARVGGAALGTYITLSDQVLASYLSVFAGMLIYLATSHILPEAHSTHPSRWTLAATLVGVVVMYAIITGAGAV
jgi:ZIP family zinc transporter